MRQIRNGLQHLFVSIGTHLIKHQRQHNGRGKSNRNAQRGQKNRVFENAPKFAVAQESAKMFQSNPRAAPNSVGKVVILEGNDHTHHGFIVKQDIIDHHRHKQRVNRPIFSHEHGKFSESALIWPNHLGHGPSLLFCIFRCVPCPLALRRRFGAPMHRQSAA